MSTFKHILFGLIFLLVQPFCAWSQNRIDSLRSILDFKKVQGLSYVKTCVELCEALVNTDEEFMMPEYAIRGLDADTLNEDIQSKFILYQHLGNHYWQVGKLSEAADQFNLMRQLGEKFSNSGFISNSLNGLGTVYYLMDNYDQALTYYRQGLALSGKDTLLKVRIYNNLANIFMQIDKTDSVLPYFNKSVQYHQAHSNYRFLAITYANMALVYKAQKNGPETRKNISLALEAALKSKDPYEIAAVYTTMGDLAYLSDSAGRYKKAANYFEKIKVLDDSLDLEQRKSRIKQMESEYMASIRNEAEIKKARKEDDRLIRDENRQKYLLVILLVAFAAILVLFLMGLQTYRLRMKITRTRERFFSMIAHDIRNPFSGILGLSGILNEEAVKSDDPAHRKKVQSLHRSLNQVYELLENLLEWSQSETGKIAFNPDVQLLAPFVDEAICLHLASGRQKGIRIANQIPSDLAARFDSNMLMTIMRNLLSNAIKFSRESGTITVSAERAGKEVVVKVSDEGIGMDQEQAARLFFGDQGISTPGTSNETGTGLGLILCRNFIARHGGRIWAESKPGEGTTMVFTLPDDVRKF